MEFHGDITLGDKFDSDSLYAEEDIKWRFFISQIKQRKGAKRATIALARKLLALIYTMLKTGSPYNEDCFEIRRKQSERKRASRMVNELQKLGYFVVAPS